ncbi:MAG: hypothetical protein ACHRHE_16550, partial [Tepidisphaerales bacterium]
IKFAKALQVVLDDAADGRAKLTWKIGDGMLVISTKADFDKDTVVVVYDIRDLLEKPPPAHQFTAAPTTRPDRIHAEQVIALIKETVEPESWIGQGGKYAQIQHHAGQLTITQTRDNHLQIVGLFEILRECRNFQVVVDVRFIRLPRGLFQDPAIQQLLRLPSDVFAPVACLDASGHDQFIKALSADKSAAILNAPRVTCFTRQYITYSVGQDRITISDAHPAINVQPTVSGDGTNVTVSCSSPDFTQERWPVLPGYASRMVHPSGPVARLAVPIATSIPDHLGYLVTSVAKGQALVIPLATERNPDQVTLLVITATAIDLRGPSSPR